MYGCAACNQGIVIGGDLVRLSAYKDLGLRHSETYIPLAQLQAGTSAYWQLRVCVYVSCCTCSPLCPSFLDFHYMWTSTHVIGLTSCAIGKETSLSRVCTGAPICHIHPSLTLSPIWTRTGHTVQVRMWILGFTLHVLRSKKCTRMSLWLCSSRWSRCLFYLNRVMSCQNLLVVFCI